MKNYSLSTGISEAIQQCLDSGNGNVRVTEKITVQAEWECLDKDQDYDGVTVYIIGSERVMFRHQEEETKIRA